MANDFLAKFAWFTLEIFFRAPISINSLAVFKNWLL